MMQHLPLCNFRWSDVRDFNEIAALSNNNEKAGFILEVDLEYGDELHDSHKDYPFCAERECPPNSKFEKLLLNLHNKKNYVIHYKMLKLALEQGLKLTRIHRVLQFDQDTWLKPYIDLNTKMRTQAKNEFEKNLYKLMSNAVYGKTMENVRKRVDIKLKTNWENRFGAANLIAKPNFKKRTIFEENLVAVELHKTEIIMNKPIVVGMAILDISKTLMYNFHYNNMKPLYGDRCKLLYTDTDSFIYQITTDGDVYDDMKANIAWFDTSDYPIDNQFNIPRVNKKVPGLFKDENNGQIMTEFVGLRAKMYSIRVNSRDAIKKAKGVKSYVVKKHLKFEHYVECLNQNLVKIGNQNLIRSKLHNLYTIEQNKILLSPYDDKRCIETNRIDTIPWGHYSLR